MSTDLSEMGSRAKPFLVGVAGGSCSGKTSFIQKMVDKLNDQLAAKLPPSSQPRIATISLESFFKPRKDEQSRGPSTNMEHPAVLDEERLLKTIRRILEPSGKSEILQIPVYDHATMSHSTEIVNTVELPVDIVFLEGALSFYYPVVRQMMDLRLFVDCDADIRLARRVVRDMDLYKKSLTSILENHSKCVKPAFEDYCLPTKKYAHIIIPRGCDNEVAIDLIVQHLQEVLMSSEHNARQNGLSNGVVCNKCQQPAVCNCQTGVDKDHLSAH